MTRHEPDTWGTGCFENLDAHILADNLIDSSKPLNFLQDIFRAPSTKRVSECQKAVAAGAALLGLNGDLESIKGCPKLVDWVVERGDTKADSTLCADASTKLAAIAVKSTLFDYWNSSGSTQATHWRSSVEQLVKELAKCEPIKIRPPKPRSFASFKKLLGQKLHGELVGNCMRMHSKKQFPGYNEYHLSVFVADIAITTEMLKYRPIVDLNLSLTSKDAADAMVVPLRLMLRSWARTIRRLDIEVPVLGLYVDLLEPCREELARLPNLESIVTEAVIWRDEDVEAICHNRQLNVVELSRVKHLTNKSLDTIGKLKDLKNVSIYESMISSKKALQFEHSHPGIGCWIYNDV